MYQHYLISISLLPTFLCAQSILGTNHSDVKSSHIGCKRPFKTGFWIRHKARTEYADSRRPRAHSCDRPRRSDTKPKGCVERRALALFIPVPALHLMVIHRACHTRASEIIKRSPNGACPLGSSRRCRPVGACGRSASNTRGAHRGSRIGLELLLPRRFCLNLRLIPAGSQGRRRRRALFGPLSIQWATAFGKEVQRLTYDCS